MRFSVWPSPARSTDEVLGLARAADAAGWYGIWFADHYMPNTEDGTVDDGDTHEAWAVLPALAAVTERLRVGPLVSPTSVHHPAVLANRAASIDHLSSGRFVLGLGAGWQVNEHGAYGIELAAPGPRVARFEEAIQIIRSLLSQPRTTFDGTYYRITDAPCRPAPVQSPLPILVGTGSPRMLRITARHADEWNTWGDPTMAGQRRTLLLEACEAVGRDPGTIHTSAQAMVFFADDEAQAVSILEHAPAQRSIGGTSSQLVDVVGQYAELGFDEFIVPDFTLGRERAQRAEAYERFHSEIASAFA
jgi:probable F420-dependent oxidoreductase